MKQMALMKPELIKADGQELESTELEALPEQFDGASESLDAAQRLAGDQGAAVTGGMGFDAEDADESPELNSRLVELETTELESFTCSADLTARTIHGRRSQSSPKESLEKNASRLEKTRESKPSSHAQA